MKYTYIIPIVMLLLIILKMIKTIKSYKYIDRISKYTINTEYSNVSFGDKIVGYYHRFCDLIVASLKKSFYVKKMCKNYEKYSYLNKPIDIIAIKCSLAIIFALLYAILSLLNSRFNFFLFILFLILGFYIYNFYLIIIQRIRNKHIEDDLLNAIVIMNNAFKSGYNITQAINFVSKDLTGDISVEFKKISSDLKYGLDINDIFNRFYQRVRIDDVKFITSSLSLLNLTGGNLVGVFESIEKSFTNRKRLKDELNAMTSSSRLVFYILLVIPIILILIINFLNPKYYNPLFKNPIGYVIVLFAIMLYVLYIIIIRKILKVD